MKIRKMGFKALALGLLAALACAGEARAADTLLFVSPLRVVIASGTDTDVLNVTNKSATRHHYVVSLVDQAMDEDGQTRTVETFPYSAKKMIRYMPRQMVLEPGQHQMVRLMVRRTPEMADGDYHTHLLFDEKPLQGGISPTAVPAQGLKMDITTQYSVAIPVVVKVGQVSSGITLDKVALGNDAKGRFQLMVGLTRTGNGEAQGDLNALVDGKPVAKPRSLRLYHEVTQAQIAMPLSLPADRSLSGKTMTVVLSPAPGSHSGPQTQEVKLP